MIEDKTIKKIKSLLAKTVENGATEEESMSALAKASELMLKYNISQAELDSKPQFDILQKSTPLIVSAVDVTAFANEVANLFDCKVTLSRYKKEINFFGHREDVDLCIFSYISIVKSCELELKKYKKTYWYKKQIFVNEKGFGRKLCNSFRKGFFMRVGGKLIEIYSERKKEIKKQNKYALVLMSKIEKVEDEFNKVNKNIRDYKPKNFYVNKQAFHHGIEKGEKTEIQTGIN